MTLDKMKLATLMIATALAACGGGANTTCNTLDATLAPAVTIDAVAADPPMATGGTIADGTYYITAGTDYVGAAGTAGTVGVSQEVFQVAGNTFESALVAGAKNESASGALIIAGINLTISGDCPSTGSATATFTATAATFTTYAIADAGTFALVYTKQ
jgi:hypothetical protein